MPRVEVPFERDNAKHRADAVTVGGTVIEFQHSPLATEDIKAREDFYERMIWVFDATAAFDAERIDLRGNILNYWMRWKRRRVSIEFCRMPVYLDIGPILLRLEAKPFAPGRWHVTPGTREQLVEWANGDLPLQSRGMAYDICDKLIAEHYKRWCTRMGIYYTERQHPDYVNGA